MKGGVRVLNKNGVTMHCSICDKADHKRKGHYKYQEAQMGPRDPIEDEDYDDPTFVEVHNLFLAFYINLSELLCSSHNYFWRRTFFLTWQTLGWIQDSCQTAWFQAWPGGRDLTGLHKSFMAPYQNNHHLLQLLVLQFPSQ